MPFHIAAHR